MRRTDWLQQLWAVLEEAQNNKFKFGRHDCARLAARAVDAMTDSNLTSYIQKFDARCECASWRSSAVEREVTGRSATHCRATRHGAEISWR